MIIIFNSNFIESNFHSIILVIVCELLVDRFGLSDWETQESTNKLSVIAHIHH